MPLMTRTDNAVSTWSHWHAAGGVRSSLPVVAVAVLLLALAGCGREVSAPGPDGGGESISAFTRGLERSDGFLTVFSDAEKGKLYLLLPDEPMELLYQSSLAQGVGSNDLSLDRGQLASGLNGSREFPVRDGAALVRFESAGERVLLRRLNTRFRADSEYAAESAAVAEAFADAVLWGFPVVARGDAGMLVDATGFLVRDSHGVQARLRQREQGEFSLDPSRSAADLAATLNFPRNTELEAVLTFAGSNPGEYLKQVMQDPAAFTVRTHHSFIALPEPGFEPRVFHPESGYFPLAHYDYATPITEPVQRRVIARHRLQKKDPDAAISEPVEPIVYYLDPGTPEPVRSALLEGARWWAQAFEAAGYRDAFRVEMLPEGANPLDVRYNVIQWVHRATRGWSYGSAVIDPRTGEIIKGHVTLGSLRVRQDLLIARGMTAPYTDEAAVAEADARVTELALARIRQLSAHEVGHTLGLAHNFAASGQDRASVMDYPHPLMTLGADGSIQLENAYDTGIGAWDRRSITYGYGDFSDAGDESLALRGFIAENRRLGFDFITDPDSREIRDLHPDSHLWDNGENAVDELLRVMELRAHALARFSPSVMPFGQPLSELEELLVPVYHYHRYQAEAAGKSLGGLRFRYALRTPEDSYRNAPVPPAEQQRALDALVSTLAPSFLLLPESIPQQVPPKAYGYVRSRESTASDAGPMLDPASMAEAAAGHTLEILLHPERLARLNLQHAEDPVQFDAAALLDALQVAVLEARHEGRARLVHQRVAATLLDRLRALLRDGRASHEVRAQTYVALRDAARLFHRLRGQRPAYADFYDYQISVIDRWLDSAEDLPAPDVVSPPPGQPIG
jgi:hypothetical protein